MIQRVYEQAIKSNLSEVVVATDDTRIANAVELFGGKYCLTDSDLQSGTDRCAQTIERIKSMADLVVNIQGDEPFIEPSNINALIDLLKDDVAEIATLYTKFESKAQVESINRVKLVCDENRKVLYFSRSVIPCQNPILNISLYKKHIGLYGFKTEVLRKVSKLKPSILEVTEKLEQLRWLQSGYTIKAIECEDLGIAIDTPEDVVKAENFLKRNS